MMDKENKPKRVKKVNPLVTMFTAMEPSDVLYIEAKMAYYLEALLTHFYQKQNTKFHAAKVIDVRKVADLEEDGRVPLYDEYVRDAKKLSKDYYGVQYKFFID